jgi:type II secretion system protein N
MKRALVIVALVAAVAAVVGALTFPTDALVRGALARVPLPDQLQLAFAQARLRPTGLRLDDVHVVRPDGAAAFDADWVRLRPSLWGFWHDRTGRPWSIVAATCQGTIDLTIGATPRATQVAVALEHVELAACLPYVLPRVDAYGRVDGTFDFEVGAGPASAGAGALEIRSASWKPGGPLGDEALRADAGALAWQVTNGRLELTKIEASSQDFQATGAGVVRLVNPPDDSVLDIRIAVTPGPTMPPMLRRYFDAIAGAAPTAQGTRTFRIQGQLRDPRVIAAGTFPRRP